MKRVVKLLFFVFIFILSFSENVKSQTFLNGDFEINTAGFDQINIANVTFDGFMSNTNAFGSFGDMDIISSATYCGLAQSGSWYVAFTGSGTDAITMQLSAPLIAGSTYTMSYWDRGCFGTFATTSPAVEIGVSATAGTFGTPVFVAPLPTNGVWVNRTFTFVAPITGAFITVQLPLGGLGDWTQVDNFTFVTTSALPPVSNFTASTTNICEGNCIAFTDVSTNSPTSWNWTFAGGTPATSTTQNPTSVCYATAGTYAVTLSVSNVSGADTLVQTSYITVNTIDTATISYPATSYCQAGINPNPTITGTLGGTFTTTPGLAITSATGTINLAASTPGTYTVTYTTASSCPATATTTITITPTPLGTFNYAGPYCQNATDPSPSLGAGASLGTFTSTAGLTINATTGVVDLSTSTPGTYTVTNTVPASGTCPPATATATITINAIPVPSITGTTSICSGATITLTATGGTTYAWSTGSTLATTNVTPLVTTTYTVTANNGGCTATATQTITVNPPATSATSATICSGSNYILPSGNTVSVAGTYNDTLNTSSGCDSVVITTLSVTPPPTGIVNTAICSGENYTLPSGVIVGNAGTYVDTVTTAGGCDSVITTNLTVNTATANAGLDTIIPYGGSTVLTASGGVTYSWSPSTGLSSTNTATTTASPLETTTYTVTVTNANGCSTTDVVTVFVELPPCTGASIDLKTIVPNAFSPNDDALNDEFCIPVNPCILSLTITLYDRWGEKVYEGNLDDCWDGLYKGKKLDSAVFGYYFTVTFIDGTTGKGKGNVSLIR